MRAERLLGAAALAAVLACSGGARDDGPLVTGVFPRVAYAGRAVPVRITGQRLFVAARRGSDGDAEVDLAFRAWLGDSELRNVRWVDPGTLLAEAPAELPPGLHDLVVADPYGARSAAPGAFECVGERPPELRATLGAVPAAPRVGESVELALDVENAGQATALAVAPDGLALSDPGLLTPAGAGAVAGDLPGGAARRFSWSFVAAAPGELGVVAGASGTDVHTGEPVSGAAPALALRVASGPQLAAAAALDPPAPAFGDVVSVVVTASNAGDVAVDAVSATFVKTGTALLELVEPSGVAMVRAGGVATLSAAYRVRSSGTIAFDVAVEGLDAERFTPVVAPLAKTETVDVPAWPTLEIASFTATPTLASRGQTITVAMTVRNVGGATAADVHPSTLAATGALSSGPDGPTPATVTLAPGETSPAFTWTCAASAAGAVGFSASAGGTDQGSGAALATTATATAQVEVQDPVSLASSLAVPAAVAPDGAFRVALTVTNTGDALALGVDGAGPPVVAPDSTSTATVLGPPSGGGVTLGRGESATIVWTLLAGGPGTLRLSAGAQATDAKYGALRATSASASLGVGEAVLIAADPFGDGATSYARIAAYAGALYLGPSRDGARIARIDPLGGAAPDAFPVSIRYDYDPALPGSSMRNPYWQTVWTGGGQVTTFGSALCDLSREETCGPDLEDGYGTLVSGTFGGQEWLLAGGSHTSGAVYFYASSRRAKLGDADALDFAYLDLRGSLFPNTSKRVGAAQVLGDALYAGYVDQGGSRPVVHVLTRAPAYPGIEASEPGGELVDLHAELMPGIGSLGNPPNLAAYVGLDAIAPFGGRVYLANDGGVVRTNVPGTPRAFADAPGDWAEATPLAWKNRTSVPLPPSGDLHPYQRAVPMIAGFGGKLFLARNVWTSTGNAAQLWRCTPSVTPPVDACDPGDWSIVTPGPASDLTQLGDRSNEAATLLVATATHLYLGFDNPANGVQLFRAATPDVGAISSWTGRDGCLAGTAGCEGLAGSGLGDPANVRFVDAAVVTDVNGAPHLYVVVGDPAASPAVPLRVLEIPE